nr:MAG TPA: hypothetical protein [Caudoviricetes sp.]
MFFCSVSFSHLAAIRLRKLAHFVFCIIYMHKYISVYAKKYFRIYENKSPYIRKFIGTYTAARCLAFARCMGREVLEEGAPPFR